ncbi:MAG: clostripain-related cysteine peptidase, partial [Candidatus Heimdallarchaeota archaeon]
PDYEWLIMVYLDGDNNLELDAINDLNELEEGIGTSGSIAVLVLFDRIDGYETSNGDWKNTRLYEVTSDSSNIITSTLLLDKGEMNMGESSSLEFLLNYGFANYSANNYWLNLWDHGGGINGICFDDTDSDFLTMDEMQDAIQTSETLYGEKFDLISHDACLMNMIEVAYELKDLADYFVASEETIPLDGFDYLEILSQLSSNPGMSVTTLIPHIIDSYSAYYTPTYTDVTLSALNLSVMDSFVTTLNSFADNLSTIIADGFGKSIDNAYFDTLFFDDHYAMDLKNFVEKIQENTTLLSDYPLLDNSALDLIDCFSSLVYYHFQGSYYSGDANGVTVFMPYNLPNYEIWIDRYLATDSSFSGMDWQNNTLWDDFLEDFYDTGFGYVSTGHPIIDLDTHTGSTSISEDEYHYFELRVNSVAIYELTMSVSAGDADLYIQDIDYQSLHQSALWNPEDGATEKIRVHLHSGVYIVAVNGYSSATYDLVVTIVDPIVIGLDQRVTASGGTKNGDDDTHFMQSLNYYYRITVTTPIQLEFKITYTSDVVDYDLFILSSSYSYIDSSESTSDTDSVVLNLQDDGTSTFIIMVHGYSGRGLFALTVSDYDETETNLFNGFSIIISITGLLTLCGIALLFSKRAQFRK